MTDRTGVGRHQWEQKVTSRTGAGSVYDPYPRFAALRAESPVHAASFFELFGVDDPIAHVWGDTPRIATLGYDVTEEVLRDNERFSSAGIKPMTRRQFGEISLMASDPPEHGRYRTLVQPAFARRGLGMWQQWLWPRLDELLDEIVPLGRADLYFEYCGRFPIYVVAMALGVEAADVETFHEWAAMMQIGAATPEEADAANRKISEYMTGIIEDRRTAPRDDLISLLVRSELDDGSGAHRLSDEAILGFVRNILPAGAGTTYRTLGILLVTLLERPELLSRVVEDRTLVGPVIDEVLRWNGPVTFAARVATCDTELAGVPVPEGALVEVGIGPANRDPQRWNSPEVFDPFRPPAPHLAFSTGPHFCVGMQVARLELEAGLERLLDRLPGIRFDPDHPAPSITGLWYRMPTGVPATWSSREKDPT